MSATTTPRTATADDDRLLTGALTVNALASGSTGCTLALGGPWLSEPLGAATWLLVAVGVGLVVFAAEIAVVLRRAARPVTAARWIIAADVAWVLGAVIVLAAGWLTALGAALLAAVSTAVACFAVAQTLGVRRVIRR